MSIHPTALVESGAEIAPDVEIGPFSIISARARIRAGTRIAGHVQILGDTTIGENCQIGGGTILGGDPQARGFDRELDSGLTIGNENIIREHVTIHRSLYEGKRTILGNGNFLMAGAHFGHDCIVGDENTVANNCLFAGHVEVGNRAFFGGGSVFHQFIRVGDLVMTQGNSGFSQDLAPYLMGASINRVAGLNAIGLRRAEISPADRMEIKKIYRLLLRSGLSLAEGIEEAGKSEWGEPAKRFLAFCDGSNQKSICTKPLRGSSQTAKT